LKKLDETLPALAISNSAPTKRRHCLFKPHSKRVIKLVRKGRANSRSLPMYPNLLQKTDSNLKAPLAAADNIWHRLSMRYHQ
jgi:hypothetical protein